MLSQASDPLPENTCVVLLVAAKFRGCEEKISVCFFNNECVIIALLPLTVVSLTGADTPRGHCSPSLKVFSGSLI